jgi:hypothetical protein
MISYFECHVTMTGDPETIRPHVESRTWKFSCINGDPVLGAGVKCYATKLFNRRDGAEFVVNELKHTADYLTERGCTVIRRKVEQVIFDDRSVKVNCIGGCVDCHLDDL